MIVYTRLSIILLGNDRRYWHSFVSRSVIYYGITTVKDTAPEPV